MELRMKKIFFGMITLAVLSAPVFAVVTTGPSNCPLAADIKSSMTSANKAIYITERKSYMIGQVSNYNTHFVWGFGIIDINAESEAEALTKAKEALPTLAGTPKPLYIATQSVWACLYSIGHGYHAIAISGNVDASNIANIARISL
jgi:hypothetical protein